MGVTPSNHFDDGYTPICDRCGIALCWDISEYISKDDIIKANIDSLIDLAKRSIAHNNFELKKFTVQPFEEQDRFGFRVIIEKLYD